MNSDSKYKLFRNFMVNELGIGREEIEQWTKEAVTLQVKKLVGQMNIEAMVGAAVRNPWNEVSRETLEDIKKRISQEVAKQITVSIIAATKKEI